MNNLISDIVSLSKRRGFIFQSADIYGGIKSIYDYGPLGCELKKNIANLWWQDIVYKRDNIVGFEGSILTHSKILEASGHLDNFSDPLIDCLDCKTRFRSDKITKINGKYQCPNCSSDNLSKERYFDLMFNTFIGPLDVMSDFIEKNYDKGLDKKTFQSKLKKHLQKKYIYLRPETAQSIFVQFTNILNTNSLKIPFGIAQQGKSFRNEIVTEHFIFRSAEFEQMELEFFCRPGTEKTWLDFWKDERMSWYFKYFNDKQNFRFRKHQSDELAHYSKDCYDIEFKYPWGWDELEGIASRGDYDLLNHAKKSNMNLNYFDKTDNYKYIPYVIEPSAGLNRMFLSFLLDGFVKEKKDGKERFFLKLHKKLAPIKVGVLPLVKKSNQIDLANKIKKDLIEKNINTSLEISKSIGKRYARHDEIGTPLCITVDYDSIDDNSISIRNRDSMIQKRIELSNLTEYIIEFFK